MGAHGNASWLSILITTAVFLFLQIKDPLGISSSSEKVSRDFSQRLSAYCYNDDYRDEIVVLLIGGEELASIGSGWPMDISVYANYLKWLAKYEPAAVFLDIGLIRGGSIAGLQPSPCAVSSPGGSPTWVRHEVFSAALPVIESHYAPVIDWNAGRPVWRRTPGRIPLVLASANPMLAPWLVTLNNQGAADSTEESAASQATLSPSAELLPTCFSDFATSTPVRWKASEDYPLAVPTGIDNSENKEILEPTAAYLLYGAYCQQERPNTPPGCKLAPRAGTRVPLDVLPELVVQWGHLRKQDHLFDKIWTGCLEERNSSFISYLFRDISRGVANEPGHLERCPFHPTLPFVFGNGWPYPTEHPRTLLKDKIVIIGTDIEGDLDQVDTPVHGAYPGALYHAMAVDNLLQDGMRYVRPSPTLFFDWLPTTTFAELLAVLGAALIGMYFRRRYLIRGEFWLVEWQADKPKNNRFSRLMTGFQNLAIGFLHLRGGTSPDDASGRTHQILAHNCMVQSTALKLSILWMAGTYIAYYLHASQAATQPVLDLVIPVFTNFYNLGAALVPALVLAPLGRFLSWLRRWQHQDTSATRSRATRESGSLIIRLAFSISIALALAFWLKIFACSPQAPISVVITVCSASFILAFWISDALLSLVRRFPVLRHQYNKLQPKP